MHLPTQHGPRRKTRDAGRRSTYGAATRPGDRHICRKQETSPPLSTEQAAAASSWLAAAGTTWRVSGAVYACWDAFRREDLRVRVSIPGGVQVS